MAEAVVTGPVDDLLRCLSEASITRLGPHWGVEDQLREIHDLMSSVRGDLSQAERKYPYSFELQDRVRELKDAVYDAEDLLEELSLEEPLRLRDGKLRRLFRHVERCLFGWRMRRELGAIAGRLRGLTDPLIGIIRSIPAEVQEVQEAREIPFVGRVDEKEKLIELLLYGGSEGDCVVVVYGEEGCGKTALVREVMKDLRVSGHFDVKIWVNASPHWYTHRVAQEIIGSSREEEDDEEEEVSGWEQSLHRLARLLEDSKRYLFILDNMSPPAGRDSERLSSLWSLMEGGGATGSKILAITTYVLLGNNPSYISMDRMDREDAVVLLRETASQGREAYHILFNNPRFLEIAEDIVGLCDGNPGKIKAVGGYLSLQPPSPAEHWDRLLYIRQNSSDSVFSNLLHGGYPYGYLTSPGVNSYNNLLPCIKLCFSLCCLFPRGHPINTHTLAELWISLGFINNDHDRRPLEDIAHHYLDLLLRGELFRVEKFDISGKVKSVTLHPHTQEIAPSIAGCKCPVESRYDSWMEYEQQYSRHRSIMNYSIFGPRWFAFPRSNLRTLLHFMEARDLSEDMYHTFIPNLNRVRVLDLHDVKADVLPDGVRKLKHLRYLDLSGNSTLKMLPPAISRLLNLQTLKLSGCSSLTELPRDMNNLSALRHLYIDGCWKLSLIPRGLCDLKCLNVLTDFILPPDDSSKTADSADLTDLCKMNDLRGSLKITNLGCYDDELMDEGLEGLLDKKSYLESVELLFKNLPTDTSLLEKLQPHPNLKGLRFHNYGSAQFPKWMEQLSIHLPNLVEIALIGCENCMYLPRLGDLPHLKKLTIQGLPDLEHLESGLRKSLPEDADDAQPFGNLSAFCIKDCPKLNFLPIIPRLKKLTLVNVSEVIFRHPCQLPNLKTLRLENIEFLEHLPQEWLRDLSNLKELHIGSCPSLGSLSGGISHLEMLKTLSIWNCKALDLSTDEQGNIVTELQGLKSLRCLTIFKALKMEHLPEWLSHVATLRFLCIRSCPSLVVLPEWIGRLHSLELIHCPGLASLPEGVHDFTSSYQKNLTVVGCPVLESQLRGKEAEEDGLAAEERGNSLSQLEEEEEVEFSEKEAEEDGLVARRWYSNYSFQLEEEVRNKRGRPSYRL